MSIPAQDLGFDRRKRRDPSTGMDPKHITPQTSLMKPFGVNLWIVERDDVRMVVIGLSDGGGAFVWNPTAFSTELGDEIRARCGQVSHVVAPNALHHEHISQWREEYPRAKFHGPPGMHETLDTVTFDFILTDISLRDYALDVDQVIFRGSYLDEVVFFHRISKTVVVGDLIQPSPEGWRAWLWWDDGTPLSWRWSFWWRGEEELARNALSKIVNQWKPEQLIVANGECVKENATGLVQEALRWIPKECTEDQSVPEPQSTSDDFKDTGIESNGEGSTMSRAREEATCVDECPV